jgi:hypothetical protein
MKKKLQMLGIIFAAILILMVLTGNGPTAASIVKDILSWLAGAATSITIFVKSLFSK